MTGTPNENRLVGNGHGRKGVPIELIGGKLLELSARFDHGGLALLTEKINATFRKNRRSRVIAAEALLPVSLAALRVLGLRQPVDGHFSNGGFQNLHQGIESLDREKPLNA
jgi:hypothetical protein